MITSPLPTSTLPILESLKPRLNRHEDMFPRIVLGKPSTDFVFITPEARETTIRFMSEIADLEAKDEGEIPLLAMLMSSTYKYGFLVEENALEESREALEEMLSLLLIKLLEPDDIKRLLSVPSANGFNQIKIVNDREKTLQATVTQLRADLRDSGIRNKILENEIKALKSNPPVAVASSVVATSEVSAKDATIDQLHIFVSDQNATIEQLHSTIDSLNLTIEDLKKAVAPIAGVYSTVDSATVEDMRREIQRHKTTIANLTGRTSAPKSVLAEPVESPIVKPALALVKALNASQGVLAAAEQLAKTAPDLSADSRKRAFNLRDEAVTEFLKNAGTVSAT